jgi:hypothetical protein
VALTRRSALIRIVVGLAALGLLGVLFVRSAQDTRETPFVVDRQDLAPWSLVLGPNSDALGSWLSLRPPQPLASPLGRQIFARAGESVNYPSPAALPLLLQSEYDAALAGVVTSDTLVTLAREAGLESAVFEPLCMAHRRVSEPGGTRGIYFVLFEVPAFGAYRSQVAEALGAAGGDTSMFDPGALSPVLIVAGLDGNFSRWLPLRANPEEDCLAPIELR